MEADKNPEPFIIDQLKEYAETRLKLAKYEAIDKGSAFAADIIADVALICCVLLAFLFASITLGFYLATVLGSDWAGFGCVTALYLLVAILVKVFKKSFEKPIVNAFIKKFFK